MCEFFPEVEKCCIFIDLKLAILFISILCIMTGVLELAVVEQKSNASFNSLKNVTDINHPERILSGLKTAIPTALSGMSVVFMVTGTILLIGALTNNEGFVQGFVWVTFVNVIVGYVVVAAVGLDCVLHSTCMLSDMDWLSAASFLVISITFLTMWLYYIIVANSFVLNAT